MTELTRCGWSTSDPLYLAYHDEEWGLPEHDDQRLFEFLLLEGAQAGLSWITILRKRENYREAFDGFDAAKIARYDEGKVEALLQNPGIVRNRLKVNAFVRNAQATMRVRDELGSLDTLLWSFTDGRPIVNRFHSLSEIPAKTSEAEAMSKALIKRGFTFVGPTICYAFMQACGMVNDHVVTCFRHEEVQRR
ncbi:MAG: DNA-3-methyladenine glycosylase I [Anaerolineae bacterium]